MVCNTVRLREDKMQQSKLIYVTVGWLLSRENEQISTTKTKLNGYTPIGKPIAWCKGKEGPFERDVRVTSVLWATFELCV